MTKRITHRELERLQTAIENDALSMSDDAIVKEGDPTEVMQLLTAVLKRYAFGPTGSKASPSSLSFQADHYAGVRTPIGTSKAPASGVPALFGPAKASGTDAPQGPKLRPRKR